MRYNRLGDTGLLVSELCLGAMTFGDTGGRFAGVAGLGQEESTALVRQAIDAGVNFIDTADVYSNGRSEEITGQAVRDLGLARADVVIATKALGPMGAGVNRSGLSRGHLLEAIDASLERLQMDYVDLYQLHGWDPLTPIEEQLRALDDIARSGRARYVGVSNWAAWQITKALGISERLGLAKFASLQAYYTIAGRDLERELVPMMESEKLGLMVWSPLAGGFLSGKYSRGDDGQTEGEGRRAGFQFPPVNVERGYAIVDAMREIGAAKGATVAQVALAWLLHQPVVTTVIVGAKRADQLADNLGACAVELGTDDLARLDQLSRLAPEYPGWMWGMQSKGRAERVAAPRRPG